MGYSLQYCENGCGNAVPGNECDWEDGVCDACRERREAGWTEHDGYTLRNALRNHPELGDCNLVDVCTRAAAELDRRGAEIERLEARVTDALTLIDAGKSSGLMRRNPPGRKLLDAVRAVLADETEAGAFPPKESMP